MNPTARLRCVAGARFAAAALLALLVGCDGAAPAASASSAMPVLPQLSDTALAQLAERRIFFGHQSVGANLLDGVADLMQVDERLRLRVVQTDSPETIDGPGFFHAFVGDNRRPDAKNADFSRIVNAGFGARGGVALLKYCYLDVSPSTDVDRLFAEYRRMVDSLRAEHPALTIVHVTQPLTVPENAIEARVRTLLGKASERELNARRQRYNRLMLQAWGAEGTVFDLARIESTDPDGTRHSYSVGNDTIFALAPAYTDDGGHLNALGRRAAAAEFIAFLARLAPAT